MLDKSWKGEQTISHPLPPNRMLAGERLGSAELSQLCTGKGASLPSAVSHPRRKAVAPLTSRKVILDEDPETLHRGTQNWKGRRGSDSPAHRHLRQPHTKPLCNGFIRASAPHPPLTHCSHRAPLTLEDTFGIFSTGKPRAL